MSRRWAIAGVTGGGQTWRCDPLARLPAAASFARCWTASGGWLDSGSFAGSDAASLSHAFRAATRERSFPTSAIGSPSPASVRRTCADVGFVMPPHSASMRALV